MINETLSQPLSSRVVSITQSELEHELVSLLYGHPESDYVEHLSDNALVKRGDT